jgi:hypothetical protein
MINKLFSEYIHKFYFNFVAFAEEKCGGQQVGTPGLSKICNGSGRNEIYQLMNGIIEVLTYMIGSLAMLAIMISIGQIVLSGGNQDSIKKGKSNIKNAFLGLVLLITMRLILRTLRILE